MKPYWHAANPRAHCVDHLAQVALHEHQTAPHQEATSSASHQGRTPNEAGLGDALPWPSPRCMTFPPSRGGRPPQR
eukprot:7381677-Prymnesium_polylepis.1